LATQLRARGSGCRLHECDAPMIWWQWALLASVQAFWTLSSVLVGVNVVNRSRPPRAPKPTPVASPQDWEEKA
jgi:hypothetical protein